MDSKALGTALEVISRVVDTDTTAGNYRAHITFDSSVAALYDALVMLAAQARQQEHDDEECRTASAYHRALLSEAQLQADLEDEQRHPTYDDDKE